MFTLDPNQKEVARIHKHWFNFSLQVFSLIIAAILPPILLAIFAIVSAISLPATAIPFIGLLYALWLLIVWTVLFITWTTYYLSAWVINDQGIINVAQKALFDRRISNLNYDRIQEIHIKTEGLIPTMLNFGTITIESAAEDVDFVLTEVPYPEQVKTIIEQGRSVAKV